jgi:16S rRNA (guanine527-N7)-methyltransferase
LKEVLDVGTGAGIPAVILSIVKPGLLVQCVDAVQKKIAFLQQVALSLHLTNLKPIHARVQDLSLCSPLICSRAFASLDDFVRLTKQQLHPQGVWMAMKARVSEDELKSVPKDIEVFHVEPIRVPFLDAQRCLVWMRPKS